MFYEYLATSLASFEKGVHKVLWKRTSSRAEVIQGEGIPLIDIVTCYMRLTREYAASDMVHVAIQIDETEAWLGVYCSEFEIGMFYQIDKKGDHRVWVTKKSGEPQKRLRSVFGDPVSQSSKHYTSDQHITNRLAPGGHLVNPHPQPVGIYA